MSAQWRYQFSVPSYLVAVISGCVVSGTLLAIASPLSGVNFHPLNILIFAAAALIVGLLPGLLLFLPTAMITIWLGNYLRLSSAHWAVLFGAFGAGITYAALALIQVGGRLHNIPLVMGLIFSAAGGTAGLVYFLMDRAECRHREQRYNGKTPS